ncbi:MAG: hypothetical protein M5U28_49805 [Sandaracinaceae bacterium]|nr:hypothetical protein [Sandaracinaceae bacterium]
MPARRHVLLLAALLFGCGSGAEQTPTGPQPSGGGEEPAPAELSALQRLNARARQGAVIDTVHGVEIPDPYRALEEDSELTREWMETQTARAQAALAEWADPQAAARLDALLSIGVIGSPVLAGDRLFYTKREGDRGAARALRPRGRAPPRGAARRSLGLRRARRPRLVLPLAERPLRGLRHLERRRRAEHPARARREHGPRARRRHRSRQVVGRHLAALGGRLLLPALPASGRARSRRGARGHLPHAPLLPTGSARARRRTRWCSRPPRAPTSRPPPSPRTIAGWS